MKLAIIGDSHCIDPGGPEIEKGQQRHHFRDTLESQRRLCAAIREESPDLVLSAGDLVDWCSPANLAFACSFMNSMGVPWEMTPGNHDFNRADHSEQADAAALWQECGVATHNRVIEAEGVRLVLIDSHNSGLPDSTGSWLDTLCAQPGPMICLTHVPWSIPLLRDLILQRQPGRDLTKYVQSKAPDFYQQHAAGRFLYTFFGHLHFAAQTRLNGSRMNILPLSIEASDREYPEQGRFVMFDTSTLKLHWRHIS